MPTFHPSPPMGESLNRNYLSEINGFRIAAHYLCRSMPPDKGCSAKIRPRSNANLHRRDGLHTSILMDVCDRLSHRDAIAQPHPHTLDLGCQLTELPLCFKQADRHADRKIQATHLGFEHGNITRFIADRQDRWGQSIGFTAKQQPVIILI
jgi:hypothetical protein